MATRYEIVVAGELDSAAAEMFAGLDITSEGELTVLTGEFDQAALHGLLERVRVLGLELVELRRIRRKP